MYLLLKKMEKTLWSGRLIYINMTKYMSCQRNLALLHHSNVYISLRKFRKLNDNSNTKDDHIAFPRVHYVHYSTSNKPPPSHLRMNKTSTGNKKFSEIEIEMPVKGTTPQDLPKHSKMSSELPTVSTSELSLNCPIAEATTNLKAYLNVCCENGQAEHAWATLLEYRSEGNLIDPNLYNIILCSFARESNVMRVDEVCLKIKEDNIDFTPQIYASILECLGRGNHLQNYEKIKMCMDEAKCKNVTMDRIMSETVFVGDQREMVVKAIRCVDSTYEPTYIQPMLMYNNKLVNSLNKNVADVDGSSILCKTQMPRAGNHINKETLLEMMQSQLNLETKGRFIVKSIATTPDDKRESIAIARENLDNLFKDWRLRISKSIENKLRNEQLNSKQRYYNSDNVYPYLRAINNDRLADFILEEIKLLFHKNVPYPSTTLHLYAGLGRTVMAEYHISTKQRDGWMDKILDVYPKYCDILLNNKSSDNPRQIWQRLEHDAMKMGPNLNIDDQIWPYTLQYNIGKFLYNIMYEDLKIDETINQSAGESERKNLLPVFFTIMRRGREELDMNSVFVSLFRNAEPDTLTLDSRIIPMLCPPLPWTHTRSGCYFYRTSDLTRLPPQAIQRVDFIASTPISDIYPALDVLNQLGSVAWKINTRVLDIIIDIFNSGGNEKLSVPSVSPIMVDRKLAKPKKREATGAYSAYHIWCYTLYQLSTANYFRDKVFWQPQNIDFRGRVFPIPRHLNHIGSDLTRCLFLFHEGKPLGKDGLRWLKLHCINLTGLKKKNTLIERLEFAEEILPEIIDSAENPLTGRKWWMASDKPWQTLACCMEIVNAMQSPDETTYISHFPVHQDGSCNGLQHYAALVRDEIDAISVNLANSSLPQDFYANVAMKVETMRQIDAAKGLPIAKILNGFITRKVLKKTVMTAVFGLTPYGAQLYFIKDLSDIKEFPQKHINQAASYLTKKTFESLRTMATSAIQIQNWLSQCASQICGVRMKNVEWVTPLGLPVLQSNSSALLNFLEKPDVAKQKIALPANFIQSLDAAHMTMTALNCGKAGITFASVHDCFWTHPATVTEMNKICREQFVLLHSQPILADLSRFFIHTYGLRTDDLNDESFDETKLIETLAAYPKPGKFELERVLDSVYFFN